MKKIIIALILFNISVAQISTPKYSNEFLRLGVSARAAGMGNAVISNANDVTAGYWNPAMLSFKPEYLQFGLMHAEYFAGIVKYDYAAFATPLKNIDKEIAVSFIRLGIDNIPNTLNIKDGNRFYFDRITSFNAVDMALLFSYASPVGNSDKFSYGINFKVIHRKVGPFANAWGFGLDVATAYCLGKLQLGAVLRDATGTFNAWSFNTETFEQVFQQTNNEIPKNSVELTLPSLSLGATYYWLPEEKKINILTSLESDIFFDGPRNTLLTAGKASLDTKIGLEASYKDFVFLRLGAYNFQKNVKPDNNQEYLTFSPTAGIGIQIKSLNINYAIVNNNALQRNMYSHLVSLKLTLVKAEE